MLFGRRSKDGYHNRCFSILGDSISTLAGYNPPGFRVFYEGTNQERTKVYKASDTWWGKVIQSFEGTLLVNNAWSGSRVTKLPDQPDEFPSGCSEARTNGLHTSHRKPDVILVYLGTNDWAYGVPPEWEDGSPGTENTCVFLYAYEKMLDRLRLNYPKADIWCCTLCETYMTSNPAFSFPHSYAGIHIERFNAIIRNLAAAKQCRLIDLYRWHIPYDSVDGSHPTASGMDTLAALMLRCMQEELSGHRMPHVDNIQVFQDTQMRIQQHKELQQRTQEAVEHTVIYDEGFRSCNIPHYEHCQVEFQETLTLLAAAAFTTAHKKTAVLNFANPVEPGGGTLRGANAQEEYLCRATNLYNCLNSPNAQEWYRLHQKMLGENQFKSMFLGTDRVLYTSGVTVLRSDVEDVFDGQKHSIQQYTNDWTSLDVITCAAPFFSGSGYILPDGDLKWLFINRIKTIFEAAIENQIQALILGAFGCGAFHNPPAVVADAFRSVLAESRYASAFGHVVFAVKRTSPCCKNAAAFQAAFAPGPSKIL